MAIEYVNPVSRPMPDGSVQTGHIGLWNGKWYVQTLDDGVTVRYEVTLQAVVRYADDLNAMRADLISYATVLRNNINSGLSSLNSTNYRETIKAASRKMNDLLEVSKGIHVIDTILSKPAGPPIET